MLTLSCTALDIPICINSQFSQQSCDNPFSISFFRDEENETEKLSNFPEVTQLASQKAEIEPQESGFKRTFLMVKGNFYLITLK